VTEESLCREALARSDPRERAAFLDEACAGNPRLRAAIEALLVSSGATGTSPNRSTATPPHEPTGEYTPAPDESSPTEPERPRAVSDRPATAAGAVLAGRYVLVEKIGEGGMGEVWSARQTEPVRREVALKLIKAGMDTKAVLQRFEQERQALALMDHPNIARVFDASLTDDSRPFFIMELVNGPPLTRFCDEAKLGIRERLGLFVSVCQAVQHAHQKGIIHRDLKPSNILVTRIDDRPVPKVIDFGVAKSVSGKLIDESLATQFGTVVGTLEYMAPEQAGFAGIDIDTRADIYSLGVILYELLTGLRPIDGVRLRKAGLTEVVRIIQQEEPSKPSTRLSTDPSLPSLAALRQTEPKKLTALLRGELDWVVMRCLEKQRDRRYETANGLARDIQRYLADEPVEARPPSTGYRLRKFLARHKGPALAAAVVLLALLGSVAASSTAAVMIWREQKRTEAERTKATENADAAIEVVRNLSTYVESYEMGSGNVAATQAQRKDRLDAALASYERLLDLHPEDAVVRWNVGRMYRMRANLCRFLDKMDEAEKSYHEAMRHFGRLVADNAENTRYREDNALTLRDYGSYLQRLGRNQEASRITDDTIRMYEELREAKPDDSNYQRNLATVLISRWDQEYQVGRLAAAEQAARKAVELYAKLAETPGMRPEPVDPLFHAMAEHNLAITLREMGRVGEALAAHDTAVERITGLTKVSNSRDAWSLYHRTRTERAWTLARVPGREAAAVADLESAIAGWDKLIKQQGETPVDLERKAVAGLYCGRIRTQLGQREAAARDLSAAAKVMEPLVGKQPEIPSYRYDLGRIYTALGQLAAEQQAAADWYRKAREMLEGALRRYPENVPYRKALDEVDALTKAKP
jgi:serine/threonine protein kinase/tetratricopeptide (TPR) repeat protein